MQTVFTTDHADSADSSLIPEHPIIRDIGAIRG